MKIEVVYALPDKQHSCWLELPDGASVSEALAASGFIDRFEPVTAASPLGVFGERVQPTDPLRDGDRLEIYRPLVMDPMQARRQRAMRQKR